VFRCRYLGVTLVLVSICGLLLPLARAAAASPRVDLKVGAARRAPHCPSGWGGRLQLEAESSTTLGGPQIVLNITSYANVDLTGRFALSVRMPNAHLARKTIRYCLKSRRQFGMLLVTAANYTGPGSSMAATFNFATGRWTSYTPHLTVGAKPG
jgi:hypothetical protein